VNVPGSSELNSFKHSCALPNADGERANDDSRCGGRVVREAALAEAHINLTPEMWFEVLNDRAFFFQHRRRLELLLGAYSTAPQIVITVDTASLIAAHEERI